MDLLTDNDIEPADAYAVVIVSDGTWEPIVSQRHAGATKPPDPLADALADCCTPNDRTARDIADRVMTGASAAGLRDNASVAIACVGAAPDSGDSGHD